MNILFYTFRTFPWFDDLKSIIGQDVFVFGKLKEDLEKFKKLIDENQPDIIIGIAKSPHQSSQMEAYAINNFHGKKIDKNSKIELYKLHCPKIENIKLNDRPSNTFCNWTMYKISEYLDQKNIDTKLIFIHTKKDDLHLLPNLIIGN